MAVSFITIAVVALTVTACAGQAPAVAAPSTPAPTSGRFQVIATNDTIAKVILLDTTTGESWTLCLMDGDDKTLYVKQWCVLERVTNRAAASKSKPT